MSKEIVAVFLCGKTYGFEVSRMLGIENYVAPTRMGTEPDLLEGFVMIRGEQIPVVDVKKRLVLPKTPVTEETKLLLLNTEHGRIGVVADGVNDIFRVEGEDLQPFPQLMNAENTNYGEYVARKGKELVIVIHPSRLLNEDEWTLFGQYKDGLEEKDEA